MANGTVKRSDPSKGCGSTAPDKGGPSTFLRDSAVERAGMASLAEGQKVGCEPAADERSEKASADQPEAP